MCVCVGERELEETEKKVNKTNRSILSIYGFVCFLFQVLEFTFTCLIWVGKFVICVPMNRGMS